MLLDTLKRAVEQIQKLESDIEQTQKDNDTLTKAIQKLEIEQREGYKSFNTDTHILMERVEISKLIDSLEDICCEADSASDSASQAVSDIENIDYYNAEYARDGEKTIMRDAQKLTDTLEDLLNPKTEEGEKDEK